MPFRLRSVNVGRSQPRDWAGIGETAIDKQPASGRVRATTHGLDGDEVGDKKHHGGVDQAVYAFAREDLDRWAALLGRTIRDGQFGENLTTSGYDLNEALIGERWRVGTAVLEVASTRTPCNDFKSWMRETGYDDAGWVKRFTADGRPGPYLRVVSEGSLGAGDEIEVVRRPDHEVTVSLMFRALTTDRTLLPELLAVNDLARDARRQVATFLGR